MKTSQFLGILLTAAAFSACGGGSNNTAQPATAPANAANTTVTTASPTSPAPSAAASPAVSNAAAGSPSAVFAAQNEARKNKDAATMKQNLSRASLELIEKDARARGITLDEWLTLDEEGDGGANTFQTRNEKITGDTAMIEINADGDEEWDVMPFVKEDGRWKIAMDKYIANLQKQIEEENAEPEGETTEETKPEGK